MNKFSFTFLSILIICLSSNAWAQNHKHLAQSVVKVFAVFDKPDYTQPWQTKGQQTKTGSGFIIEDQKILTNAHVVAHHTFVQVQRFGDPNKYIAKVLAIGHECDVAVLTVEDPQFYEGTEALVIEGQSHTGDKVTALGFPSGGNKISLTEGVVSRIEMTRYAHSFRKLLTMQIDAALNSGNSGGPVLRGGKVIGIAMQTLSEGENIGYIIPAEVVLHFLDDLKDGIQHGFPAVGIYGQTLESPSYRKSLGMSDEQSGVVITRIIADSSAWNKLHKNDVILKMDGIDVANNGTISFQDNDRIGFAYHITKKQVGEPVNMEILRKGKVKNIEVILKPLFDIAPFAEYDKKPDYYIWGGLVFVRLSGQYLSTKKKLKHHPAFLYHYHYGLRTPQRHDIIVLKDVLAHKSNFGFHDIGDEVLTEVNGQKVKDLKHLIEICTKAKGQFMHFGFDDHSQIVLERKSSLEALPEILKQYNIPAKSNIAA